MFESHFVFTNVELLASICKGLLLSSANNKVLGIVFIRVIDYTRYRNHVNRDAMAPPQLTTDAPVLDVFKPVKPCLFVCFWQNQKVFVSDGIARTFRHVFAVNIPLRFKIRLNNIITL